MMHIGNQHVSTCILACIGIVCVCEFRFDRRRFNTPCNSGNRHFFPSHHKSPQCIWGVRLQSAYVIQDSHTSFINGPASLCTLHVLRWCCYYTFELINTYSITHACNSLTPRFVVLRNVAFAKMARAKKKILTQNNAPSMPTFIFRILLYIVHTQ